MKRFIVSAGNPIAFFVLLFSNVPGTIIKLGGNMFRFSLLGIVALVALGYVYLAVCALLRKTIKRNGTLSDQSRQISDTMYHLSMIGLIPPSLLFFQMEGNVFGFLVFLPTVLLALVWIGFSLYAIFKNPKIRQEVDGSRP